jgi:hypothetical protein
MSANGALTSELSHLLSRVAAYDALVAERDALAKSLAATSEALREAESRAVGYSPLAEERDALDAETRSLRAQLAMAEEETRRTKPMRDALVRELQARRARARRTHNCPPRMRQWGARIARTIPGARATRCAPARARAPWRAPAPAHARTHARHTPRGGALTHFHARPHTHARACMFPSIPPATQRNAGHPRRSCVLSGGACLRSRRRSGGRRHRGV